MSDKYGDLIAGSLISQELLVRLLEEQGILEEGAFCAHLEEYLARVPANLRDERLYVPIRALVKSLSRPRRRRRGGQVVPLRPN
jgi:hypothetical protein